MQVKRIRIGRKMRQNVLAREAGISTRYLRMIENDEREPRNAVLLRLAGALEVSLDELIGASDGKTKID